MTATRTEQRLLPATDALSLAVASLASIPHVTHSRADGGEVVLVDWFANHTARRCWWTTFAHVRICVMGQILPVGDDA